MRNSNLNSTIDTLSVERLDSYKSYFNLNSYDESLNLYLWNDALASCFFKLISIFEVAFRNMIHSELSRMYSNNRTQGNIFNNDWYIHLMNSGVLNPVSSNILKKTTHITRRGNLVPKNPAPIPGKVIAAQTFGFWIKVIETTSASINWKNIFFNGLKGHFALHETYWDSSAIEDLLVRLEEVNELRNRIAHHEPLWKFTQIVQRRTGQVIYQSAYTPEDSILRMQTLNQRMCLLLGWISQDRRSDYESSYYKRHFDWFCREKTIEIYKNNNFYNSINLSKGKRDLSKLMKNSCLLELTHKHGSIFITKDF
ncbi:Abi family protein [Acinetobacter junii]|uniref:Abi family protein n=1 Tax=Acinetobacter junii TaxID=40215 RepID=UPI001F1E2AAC|nr:Abi family protein [Acinetobacter junii]MCE6003395.1 Abi family protein [Acinetobacter junii]